MSRPAVKCGPEEEMTTTRASAAASISRTIWGNSRQNAGVMLFRFAGRDSTMCAIRSFTSTSKHS